MGNLLYDKFKMQSYFKNGNLSKCEAQHYFKFRTRMEDFADNFKNGSFDISCRLCSQSNDSEKYPDSQQHFLNCKVMIKEEPDISTLVEREMYSTKKNINYQKVKILLKAIDKRWELLSN